MPSDTLPNFKVSLVQRDENADDAFLHNDIVLSEFVTQQHMGLILYFYPKDNTPGCSTQATDFSTHLAQLNALGYQVIGVSRDSIKSHEKFILDKSITFPLISDKDEALCQYFDIIGEKKLYGKVSLGVVRSTLVFDKTGRLILEQRNVRANGHVEALISQLSQYRQRQLDQNCQHDSP